MGVRPAAGWPVSRVVGEVVLPRRALPQPRPGIMPRGDCAGCCFAGLTGWPIERVYAEIYDRQDAPSNPVTRTYLHAALALGLLDRLDDTVPVWHGWDAQMQWGLPGRSMALGWWGRVRMAIDAGYYGLAEVCFAKTPDAPTDHVVLICGAREVYPPAGECGAIHHEILVSCSAAHPDGVWVEVGDFLRSWGGFNLFLARPAP